MPSARHENLYYNMETPQKETQSKVSASSITVEETTQYNVTMSPIEQHTMGPTPSSHTLPTSTIQPGRTSSEQPIISQRNTTHSTRLDAPMTVPTQIIGERAPRYPPKEYNRKESIKAHKCRPNNYNPQTLKTTRSSQ